MTATLVDGNWSSSRLKSASVTPETGDVKLAVKTINGRCVTVPDGPREHENVGSGGRYSAVYGDVEFAFIGVIMPLRWPVHTVNVLFEIVGASMVTVMTHTLTVADGAGSTTTDTVDKPGYRNIKLKSEALTPVTADVYVAVTLITFDGVVPMWSALDDVNVGVGGRYRIEKPLLVAGALLGDNEPESDTVVTLKSTSLGGPSTVTFSTHLMALAEDAWLSSVVYRVSPESDAINLKSSTVTPVTAVEYVAVK